MLVLRFQLLEELGDVHAGPIREVLGFVLIFSVVTARVAHDEVSKSFEVAALELHGAIIASEDDKLLDSATLVCRSLCTGRSGCAARGDVTASLSCESRRSSDARRTADRSRLRSRRSRVQFG